MTELPPSAGDGNSPSDTATQKTHLISDAAKMIGWSPGRLFEHLDRAGLIFRRGRRRYPLLGETPNLRAGRRRRPWVATETALRRGLLVQKDSAELTEEGLAVADDWAKQGVLPGFLDGNNEPPLPPHPAQFRWSKHRP